jgi:hypothetical protein
VRGRYTVVVMAQSFRRVRAPVAAYATVVLAISMLATRTYLSEHGMPERRYYPKVSSPPALQPREIEYLEWLDWFIGEASDRASREQRRFRTMMVAAAVAGSAAITSLAAGLPTWSTATLAFVAACCVGSQAVLRDQQCSVTRNAMVVELQAAKRSFRFGGEETDEQLRRRFQEFRRQVEAIKKRRGERILKALASPPPKLRLPISS